MVLFFIFVFYFILFFGWKDDDGGLFLKKNEWAMGKCP